MLVTNTITEFYNWKSSRLILLSIAAPTRPGEVRTGGGGSRR